MKDVKQIREQFDLITEKEEKEDRKLSALVRAGLYDSKKLPALKRALDKSADKITSQEKRMLINLLDSLISQVVSDDQVYRKVRQNVHNVSEAKMDTYSKFDPRYKAGWPTDKEMPSVLILKRKAIRVYPDNQKVALYYSQALDKYVTIPYNDIQVGLNEAKNNDKKKKKRYYVKPKSKEDKDKDPPKPGGIRDTINFIKRKGAHKPQSKLSKAGKILTSIGQSSSVSGAAGAIGGAIGSHFYNKARAERTKNSLAKVKNTVKVAREKHEAEKAAKSSSPKPTSSSVPKTSKSTSTPIRKKSGAATRQAMSNILKKNSKATFSKAAVKNSTIKESNVLDTIRSIVENNITEQKIQFNENEITINNTVAKKLLTVYESINRTNKKKMEQMLNEDATSFNKVLMFAVRQ
jgi:hypothetical protein